MAMKLKKKILSVAAGVILATALIPATPANAVSLAESFSGSTQIEAVKCDYFCTTWKKTCTASTDGYYKRHYVRAYIGGTNAGPNSNTWVDSGRCYSNGNITKPVSAVVGLPNDQIPRLAFPTGYAKYGN